ncbi:hypothetical protein MLD38_018565 [Melastoma candidum]|uniref:Uncharacterized protein n=1 Tax=Melastoma candidum TaxID=119954 RepID=A0ACB9QXB7_9MYRT|nr:hypothetical protein MLD38_018565 [Melastoma candidum]
MGSLSGTSEIAEVMEEPGVVRHSKERSPLSMGDKERKEAVIRLALRDSLEDDINQLFESFRVKSMSRVSSPSHPDGTSPMRKNTLKKPISVSAPRSPGFGNSEPLSLKQALRDLCLSKASEMAAIKRSSIHADPSRISEAGRINHLFNEKLVEVGASRPNTSKGKETMVEITLVPEECDLNYSKKASVLQPLEMDSLRSGDECFAKKQEGVISVNVVDVVPLQNDMKQSLTFIDISSSDHSAVAAVPSVVASSTKLNSPLSKVHDLGTEALKVALPLREKNVSGVGLLPSASNAGHVVKEGIGDATLSSNSVKAGDKPVPLKQGHKGARVQGWSLASGSAHGRRVGRAVKNAPRTVKPVIRTRSTAKKKVKPNLSPTLSISETSVDIKSESILGNGQLICQRCQCFLQTPNAESNKQVSQASRTEKSNRDVSVLVTPPSGSNNCKLAVDCVKSNSKLRDKGEFSQSSKSSLGDFSSSTTTTSLSNESNLSRSSWSNRPHMSKDVGWEAIRQVWRQDGSLGLRHFNLLKKLGCGDIGTVYLAELIGMNCLFAIKVMDNEFLARRKKMLRAQTEREILRILDHPFLPTLYSQFTSDNLSCLVMEYCPGGDLHVLRQKQPGRHFLEPAARFYVAEVLLALEYLHMLGIIYRDLKPENILVKDDGHIMLTDFDLSLRCLVNPTLLLSSSLAYEPAKISGPCAGSNCIQPFCTGPSCQVSCFSPKLLPPSARRGKSKSDTAVNLKSLPQLVAEPTDARSNSFVGTHEYLAPEIIKGEGHGAAVDWWTFGIFLYELLYGRTPFKGAGNEETLANVVLQSLHYPESPTVSPQAQDLIGRLLVKDPESRLGTEKGAAEIKLHPFFEGLNWALIRCTVPPELPGGCYEFGSKGKFTECNAAGEPLEFELF